MRFLLLSTVAFLALAAPAIAQDRTLPAGTTFEAQPPIDRAASPVDTYAPLAPTYEGRSVDVAPARQKPARHAHPHL